MDRQVFELKGELLDIAVEWRSHYKAKVKADAKKLKTITGQEDPSLIERSSFYGKKYVVGISANVPGSLPMKDFPGYFKPDKRTKLGKALLAALVELNRGVPFEPALEKLGILWADVMEGSSFGWASGFNIGDRYFISVPLALMKPDAEGRDLPTNPDLIALTALELEDAEKQCQ